MNFGGPIDLTPFGGLLRGIGLLYWGVALGAAGLALWLPKRWIVKLPLAALVLAGFIYPIAARVSERKQTQSLAQTKLDQAMLLFEERCKTAGERITRTVENVEGVVWMKWREPGLNRDDQFKLDDPYGKDCWAEDCIVWLLRMTRDVSRNPEGASKHRGAYKFVETVDPRDGRWYRYFGAMKLTPAWTPEGIAKLKRETGEDPPSFSFRASFEREPIDKPTARYGITWDDISTREDREHWIAGGSLKVIDRQSNEVIAERVGYMVDRGQGSKAGGAAPWLEAQQTACPLFSDSPHSGRRHRRDENRELVIRVLQPSKGE